MKKDKNIKEIDLEIDISNSDISYNQIIVDICEMDNLIDLHDYLKKHKIKLVKNQRYDKKDYKNIANEFLVNENDWTEIQLSHWLSEVGNKMFSIK